MQTLTRRGNDQAVAPMRPKLSLNRKVRSDVDSPRGIRREERLKVRFFEEFFA